MNDPQEQQYSPAAQKSLDGLLTVKSHGYMQNEREKKLAFEREDAMRLKLEEALLANKEMGLAIERIARHFGFTGTSTELAEHLEQIVRWDS